MDVDSFLFFWFLENTPYIETTFRPWHNGLLFLEGNVGPL